MGRVIVGIDEVGRGPLAGPVVAAAVILPEEQPWFSGIKDSKKISAKKREALYDLITQNSVYAIRDVSPEIIDEMNILYASLYAMKLALESVCAQNKWDGKPLPEVALIDGNHTIPCGDGWLDLDIEQVPIVNGDNLNKYIGAASIIAKVYRDRLMTAEHEKYPEYGFNKHAGYGTKQHFEAIQKYGPCPIHRKTFSGVRQYLK